MNIYLNLKESCPNFWGIYIITNSRIFSRSFYPFNYDCKFFNNGFI
ncbi:hypothetical protein RB2501_06160 [Robiginitalea biformata HTCC2501]|uniref:Uncharacterized protein n=1 Tax=Robiginitalea biformata (strain ATCC BAA-864 / DSM 15991 / KCTC 12146 / HTCC2501) TaxID=313596 RepID=A4CHQ2_ROBBH|nr:hypothetical protein RB2501_06160 [Robiginitalea biformata HTCC2501]